MTEMQEPLARRMVPPMVGTGRGPGNPDGHGDSAAPSPGASEDQALGPSVRQERAEGGARRAGTGDPVIDRPAVAVAPAAAPVGERAREALGFSLEAEGINAWYGDALAIKDVSLTFKANQVTALIGPSGCGKSTFLRCLNRIHEVTPGRPRVAGRVVFDGQNIYDKAVDPVRVRRYIGMIFQKPNPFPLMSIYDNVVAGLKLNGVRRRDLDEIVERSLRGAALWTEVKDKLKASGASLSGGQQQRLCIARAIAVEPEVILMDEPCSALDPIATYKIEELIRELKRNYTVVIVTHNMQQASRVADWTAFMLAGDRGYGELVEYGATQQIFTGPRDKRTEDYITGRFG